MKIGFIGSGSMAEALAIGLGEPALFSDSGSGRAAALAEITGGRATSNVEIARSCEVVFLCHKPAQLELVAAEIVTTRCELISVLAATPISLLRAAYPDGKILRVMPNTPVELRSGVICVAAESDKLAVSVNLLARLGTLVTVPESQFGLATAIGGCAPAFYALFMEKLVDTAQGRGMSREDALTIAGHTLLGTGALLVARGMDIGKVISAVASPGGLTERALSSFEKNDLAAMVEAAVATVLNERQ